ncbi:DsbA family protein [Meridianimarinicoccus sp. RP-17]|uniref:2-hydroxychromene-2-carboxylate isomerase n=1 Tax=Meridianimarinicoccus zhengii TaxID=2056810 RepID=UPI000DACE08D|nr:2-hydroxychromene-2-carboxylate isomerase [Phycocomes zhengii]
MTRIIDYYFAPISGYAYLGHRPFLALATETGAQVRFRPIEIGKVFAATGTTPPAAQSDVRKSYRMQDQARLAAAQGLPMQATPAHWPTAPGLACRAIVSAGVLGLDQEAAAFACLRAVWAEDRDIADPDQLAAALDAAGLPAAQVMAEAARPEIARAADECTAAAIAAGVFGSPTYVLGTERFWGQDRLELLRDALTA